MRFTLSLLVVLALQSQADELWFEKHWILDREATLEIWAHEFHPEYRDKILTGITNRWDETGETELLVDAGMIALRFNGKWYPSIPYFIRPIEPGVFEVTGLSELQPELKSVVHKTVSGFCRTDYGYYKNSILEREIKPTNHECYKQNSE